MPQGKVKWFSTEKAFGFIEQENDNDIFVHVTGLADGVTAIDKDMLVEYEVEQGRKGPQATNVRPPPRPPRRPPRPPRPPRPSSRRGRAEEAEVVEDVEVVEVVEVEDEAGDVEIVEIDEEVVVEPRKKKRPDRTLSC